MKVSKKIRENYNAGIDIFRRSIVKGTLSLCKMVEEHRMGIVCFEEPIVLSSVKKMKRGVIYETKVLVADRLVYRPEDNYNGLNLYALEFGDSDAIAMSTSLSLDDLDTVYKAVYKTVLHYKGESL